MYILLWPLFSLHQVSYVMDDSRINHLRWTSQPLRADIEVVGFPVVSLWVSSSTVDANLFVYLEAVDLVTGKGYYVTEGMFRLSQRKEIDGRISSEGSEYDDVDMRYLPGKLDLTHTNSSSNLIS